MISFQEFLVLEAFDLEKRVEYYYSPSKTEAMAKLGHYPNLRVYQFYVGGIEYVVYSFMKKGFVEFHFADLTNAIDVGNEGAPKADAMKVFGMVLKIIYDTSEKYNMDNVRITYPKERERLYFRLFDLVKDKFRYTQHKPYYYETMKDAEGIQEDVVVWAFNLTKGNYVKHKGEVMTKLKEALSDKKNEPNAEPELFHYHKYHLDDFKKFLSEGANPNTSNAYDLTPIHYAISFNDMDYVKMLVEFGADVNHQGNLKKTPLHIASIHNNIESVKYLIEKGADVTIRDIHNKTPLDYAKQGSIMDYLIKHMKQNNIPMENLNA